MDADELRTAMRFLELDNNDLAALTGTTAANVRHWLAERRPVPEHVARELDLYRRLAADERRRVLAERHAAMRRRPRASGPGRPRRRPLSPANPERPDEEK